MSAFLPSGFAMQKHSKIRNVPFPRTCGATGNDAQKLHAPAFTYFRGAVLMHEVSCRQERPANRALLPVLSFAQSYSTLLPGLSGGQLACGGRRTWESHPSEDLSELHRWFEAVAVQKYHYRQMRSWRDGLPKPLLDERVSLGTFRFGTFIDTGRDVQVVMARSPHRFPPSYRGSSADVIQLPDMAGNTPAFFKEQEEKISPYPLSVFRPMIYERFFTDLSFF